MNIEFDAYKQKLNDCRPALDLSLIHISEPTRH